MGPPRASQPGLNEVSKGLAAKKSKTTSKSIWDIFGRGMPHNLGAAISSPQAWQQFFGLLALPCLRRRPHIGRLHCVKLSQTSLSLATVTKESCVTSLMARRSSGQNRISKAHSTYATSIPVTWAVRREDSSKAHMEGPKVTTLAFLCLTKEGPGQRGTERPREVAAST